MPLPPPKSKKRVSSADGFVARNDSGGIDDGGSDGGGANEKNAKRAKLDGSADGADRPARSAPAAAAVPGGGQRDEAGDAFWELSKNRRVTISEFRGRRMVNIREYYEKDGKALPAKKGISLPVEQYSALVALLPHIETVLVNTGEDGVSRPDYSTSPPSNAHSRDGTDPEKEGEDQDVADQGNSEKTGTDETRGNGVNESAEASRKQRERTEGKRRKANFEATSDEDDG